jgi:hypothetical protein
MAKSNPSAVYMSVALSLRLLSPDVIRHPTLWSSDFPPVRPFGSARSLLLGTTFHSPAETVLFRKPPRRDRRSWPIPSNRILNASSSPFDPGLASSAAFDGWGGSKPGTRCPIPHPAPPDFHRLPLPFRTFVLPAHSALPVTESGEAYLSRQPDFPSLPDSANYH